MNFDWTQIDLNNIDYGSLAWELGCISEMSSSNTTTDQKKQFLNEVILKCGLLEANIINTNGINIFNGVNSSERDYFKAAMLGEYCIYFSSRYNSF